MRRCFCMRLPTIFADFAYEFGRCICYRNGDEREIMWAQSSPGRDCQQPRKANAKE